MENDARDEIVCRLTFARFSLPGAKDGKPIGVEITAPTAVPLDRLNRLLADLGETPLNEHDYQPVRAA
jgi:hypothetical protein